VRIPSNATACYKKKRPRLITSQLITSYLQRLNSRKSLGSDRYEWFVSNQYVVNRDPSYESIYFLSYLQDVMQKIKKKLNFVIRII